MAEPHYFLRDGEVWYQTPQGGEHHICGGSEKLSVAIFDEGFLHKHGTEAQVSAWADEQRAKMAGKPEMAEMFGFEVITFKINQAVLDELNKCIANTTRSAGFVEFLSRQPAEDFAPDFP